MCRPSVDLDFVAELVDSGKTIFIDYKGMIDFGSLLGKEIDISSFPSHDIVAFNMGKDSIDQKRKFIGMNEGPTYMEEVVYLYNYVWFNYNYTLHLTKITIKFVK